MNNKKSQVVQGTRQSTNKQFSQSFSSEKLLQQALAGLLELMPDTSGVQVLQGTQELGKDLIFNIRGGFEEPMLCACVVKNIKITGDAGRAEGARTVFLQAQQCFDTPYVDAAGKELYIDRVYIITPFDLPPATITSIKGQLRERSGQVMFIGGVTLFDLFKKYWPDYLADEAEAIEQHIKQTVKGLEDDNPLLGIAMNYHVGNVKVNSKKVYVPQVFFRELYSYQLGNILTNPFPDQSMFSKTISLNDINRIKSNFKRFEEALTYLEEWELYTRAETKLSHKNIHDLISEFQTTLEIEWKNTVIMEYEKEERKRAKREKREFPNIDPDKKEIHYAWLLDKSWIRLNEYGTYIQMLRRLSTLRVEGLSTVNRALKQLDYTVRSTQISSIGLLSDQIFLSSSNINDCAHAAPDGLFKIISKKRIKYPKNIIDKWSGPLLIVGAAGFGKTSFCRWNALRDAERFNAGKASIVPVYIPLHRLATKPVKSFKDAFLGTLGKSALVIRPMDSDDGARTIIRLYLDGLDEIPSPVIRKRIVDLAKQGTEGKDNYQIVITARDHIYGPYLNWLPRISLGGFDQDDVKILVNQWLGKNSEGSKLFYEQLKGVPSLANLMHIPLLATLTILVFRQTGKLPENRTRLYQVFVELLSGGWDMAKKIQRASKYGQVIKLRILQALASKIHEKRQREFGNDEIITAIRSTFSKSLLSDWERLRDEIIEDGLVSRGGGVLQFAHLSFQEFLTAKNCIGEPHARKITRALEAYLLGDGWWKEVIRFYVGLTENPSEIVRWLVNKIEYFVSMNKDSILKPNIAEILTCVTEFYPDYPIEKEINKIGVEKVWISFNEYLRRL